jgi:hypothetical protein
MREEVVTWSMMLLNSTNLRACRWISESRRVAHFLDELIA